METYHILLVEDARDILSYNRRRLTEDGYRVTAAATAAEARQALREGMPDLMVLDIVLPDGSGLDLCRAFRAASAAPVLFLTSLNESEQVVRGLRAGGDDYMTKPFSYAELLARIEAQLRRMERLCGGLDAGAWGALSLDPAGQRAFWEGRDMTLSPKEYQLLTLLMRGRNRWADAEELYAGAWGMAAGGDARTVTVHLSSLRNKLRRASGGKMGIESSRARGYRLTGEHSK